MMTPVRPDRGIDHLVLCVCDLDRAATVYEALGFTVTPKGIHPWGTANRLIQLQGSFLEILSVEAPEKIQPHDPRGGNFSFGAFNRDTLARREGFSMLVFESKDARADRNEFAAKGLADLKPFDFERTAKLPDGSEKRVAFSLAFVPPLEAPEAVFFTCQQHAPELFWKPDYQRHDNGALSVDEVAMVAEDPGSLAPLLAGLQDQEAVSVKPDEVVAETARGRVRVLAPTLFEDWYGPLPEKRPDGPHFAGMRLTVGDLGAVAAQLERSATETAWARSGLIVPASQLFGCALAFAQA